MSDYEIKIEDDAIYINTCTSTYNTGFKLDLESVGCHDCLNIADKLKRCYYQKLQEGVNK